MRFDVKKCYQPFGSLCLQQGLRGRGLKLGGYSFVGLHALYGKFETFGAKQGLPLLTLSCIHHTVSGTHLVPNKTGLTGTAALTMAVRPRSITKTVERPINMMMS